jgi:hypothetical protein
VSFLRRRRCADACRRVGGLLVLSAGLLVLAGDPALAGEAPDHPHGLQHGRDPIPLRCRDGQGPWQDCQLLVESVGERWSLLLNGQRIEFRHDGRGTVTMQRHGSRSQAPTTSPWIPVEARWSEEPALCWDGLCAQGDLPLD